MIHESPESILKTFHPHPISTQAAGTVDGPATAIQNRSRGNFRVLIDHGATAAAHTLAVSVLHRDSGGAYAIANGDDGNPLTFSVAASQAAARRYMRVRADRLKDEVALRSVVVGASGVLVSTVIEQFGLDSADCDGTTPYVKLT